MLAVDHRLGRSLRVLAGGVLPLQLLRPRREQQELGEVAIEHRQIGDLTGVEARRDVGTVRGEQRRTAGDGDLVGELTDFEDELHWRLRIDADFDALHDRSLEAGELGLHLVRPGQQALFDEHSVFGGDDGVGGLSSETGDVDSDAGENGAARIRDRPADAAIDGLRAER